MTLEDQEDIRRVVREEVRAALRDMVPVPFTLLNYKQAAKWMNNRRAYFDERKPLTARDMRQWVEAGTLRAFTFGDAEPRIAVADLAWNYDWANHTRDEKDRLWNEYKEGEKRAAEQRRKAQRQGSSTR